MLSSLTESVCRIPRTIYSFDGVFALGFRPVSTSVHQGTLGGGLSSKFARKTGLRFSKKALTPSFTSLFNRQQNEKNSFIKWAALGHGTPHTLTQKCDK